MRIKTFTTVAALAAAAFSPALWAQEQSAPVSPSQITPDAGPQTPGEQILMDRSVRIFSIIASALQSEELPTEEKNAVFGCIYQNPLRLLSEETGKVISENPQLSETNDSHVYLVIATICGAREAGATPPAQQPQATPQPDEPSR